jgi:hypothetical protein
VNYYHYELEDKVDEAGWNFSRKLGLAKRALERVGVIVENLKTQKAPEAVYAQLTGEPNARRAYTVFLNAKKDFADVSSQYNKAVVGPRFADSYHATSTLAENAGLFQPRLKVAPQLLASGGYADGVIGVSQSTLTDQARRLVNLLAHEATHEEQQILQIGLTADTMNIGTTASSAQIQAIHLSSTEGNILIASELTVSKALAVRAGRFLTDEAAERAAATASSMKHIMDLAAHEGPNRLRAAKLDNLEARSTYGLDPKGVLLELGHPETGLALNTQLFGAVRGPELYGRYAGQLAQVQNFDKLPRKIRNQIYSNLSAESQSRHKRRACEYEAIC